ncbi:unnamed protein product, partial [marine sediment metagenome]
MSVDYIISVCAKDFQKLHADDELRRRVASHGYPFDNVIVVRNTMAGELPSDVFSAATIEVCTDDHPHILTEFGIPEHDEAAEHYTHGPDGHHYWKKHVVNHLVGLKVSTAGWIVFSDSDCRMLRTPSRSWIEAGMSKMAVDGSILIVAPND